MPSPTSKDFDTSRTIRVHGREFQRFQKVCASADVSASTVLRALMQTVVARGLEFDPVTGKPTIK